MKSVEILMQEHQNILRFTALLRKESIRLMEGAAPQPEFWRACVDFARNYADKLHHGKEEKILFRVMEETQGQAAQKLIRAGMLVEHDLGRMFVRDLEAAVEAYEAEPSLDSKLDIITNATAYAGLLGRHIEKEDGVVYTFAERGLSDELKTQVDEESRVFDAESEESRQAPKLLAWLDAHCA